MPDDLYWKDIVGWSDAQADGLRRLARGERVNDLDWENLIEEVVSVGRSELKSARSLLRRALEHVIKIHSWPGQPAVRHWRAEARTFLTDARERMDPGMIRRLDVADTFAEALEDVREADLPPPERPLPTAVALDPREVREVRLSVDDLLGRIVTTP